MAINTPANPRMSAPWTRLTPNNSPFNRASPSPKAAKSNKNDAGLSLRHVIGTTASAANSIDTLPASNSLAFTAGAAAVLATFNEDLSFKQRFYRARPTAVPLNPSPSIYEPSTPTGNSDLRRRTAVFTRDVGTPGSPLTPSVPDFDSPAGGGKSWAAKERVKSATCVSFSRDGKYLAIGETGYKPRVLIFSTSPSASPYIPLTALADHTFGVKAVAFSPDSAYLASLGTANDGFLYIWSINSRNGSASLYASNKCTSNIYGVTWMGSNLVTFGTRHVKLWRLEGSSPSTPVKLLASFLSHSHGTPRPKGSTGENRILAGRNCLLGALLEGVFTCATALSRSRAIVCSESGDVCLLDDSEGRQSFVKIADAGFTVTAVSIVSPNQIQLAGKGGVLKTFEVDKLLKKTYKRALSRQSSVDETASHDSPFVVALAPFGKLSVSVDTNRFIRLIRPLAPDVEGAPEVALQLPAHGGPVLGVRPCRTSRALDATFFTWSAEGTILFWNSDGILKKTISAEVEQPENSDEVLNELKVVRLCGSRNLVTGDKCGVLRVIDLVDGKCQTSLRAHAGEITDIALYETDPEILIASSGRDRTVQVFDYRDGSCDLLQTLDEHVGAVTGLVFTPNGKHLLSCSSDRTVVVREAMVREENGQSVTAFIILRTVTLKATPVSMTIPHDRDDILWISAVDRNVHKYNLRNGHLSDSFKVTDNEGSDAVVLSSLACVPTYNSQNTSMIAGVSTTDKSIRVYDENGLLLGRDWGHTEGVTDLTLIKTKDEKDDSPGPASLVTVAADGTVFIWAFGSRTSHKRDLSQSMELMGLSNTPTKDLLVNKPPLRRVLSQTEMARFQNSSTEDETMTTPTATIKKAPAAPTIARRGSRFSLAQTPRLDPPISTSFDSSGRRRATKGNSPSPPTSPKSQRTVTRKASNPTISSSSRSRTRSTNFDHAAASATSNALATSTDAICRNLRSYRKKLATSSDDLSPETLKALERELGLTARAVGEKAMKARGVAEETVMVKLLSQYSERLLEMLDSKFAAGLAREMSLGGSGSGSLTPPESAAGSGASNSNGEDAMALGDERHPSIQEEEGH